MSETTTAASESPAELGAGDAAGDDHVVPDGAHGDTTHGHPSPVKYVVIALILALVTAVEVGLYYVEMADGILVALLLSLALLKFVTVVAYFMHLKFDNRVLRRFFVTGLILAGFVYGVVLVSLGLLRS